MAWHSLDVGSFFVIVVLESRRVDHDEDDEEVGRGGFETHGEEYLGEEEEESGMRAQK